MAVRKGWKTDNVTVGQLDWVLTKRPIKQISNRMNASPLKFLILTARAKDIYEGVGKNPQKVGLTPEEVGAALKDKGLGFGPGHENA